MEKKKRHGEGGKRQSVGGGKKAKHEGEGGRGIWKSRQTTKAKENGNTAASTGDGRRGMGRGCWWVACICYYYVVLVPAVVFLRQRRIGALPSSLLSLSRTVVVLRYPTTTVFPSSTSQTNPSSSSLILSGKAVQPAASTHPPIPFPEELSISPFLSPFLPLLHLLYSLAGGELEGVVEGGRGENGRPGQGPPFV